MLTIMERLEKEEADAINAAIGSQEETAQTGQDGNTDILAAPETPDVAPVEQTENTTEQQEQPQTSQELEQLRQALEAEKREREKAEQKYRVVEGKLKAEIPAYAEKVKQQERELNELRAKKPVTFTDFLPEEDVEDLEPAYLNATARMINEALKKSTPVPTDNAALEGLRIERFYDKLEDKVSDWETITDSSDFQAWANTPDPIHGITPMQSIHAARQSLDHKAAAKVFSVYKETVVPKANGNPKGKTTPAPSLPSAAAPVAQPVTQNGKKTYTLAEWADISTKFEKGKFGPSDSPRAQEVMKELDAALLEGRVKT